MLIKNNFSKRSHQTKCIRPGHGKKFPFRISSRVFRFFFLSHASWLLSRSHGKHFLLKLLFFSQYSLHLLPFLWLLIHFFICTLHPSFFCLSELKQMLSLLCRPSTWITLALFKHYSRLFQWWTIVCYQLRFGQTIWAFPLDCSPLIFVCFPFANFISI